MSLCASDIAAMSEFAGRTKATGLPGEVARFGRLLFLDTIGVMMGGLRYPEVQALSREIGGRQGNVGVDVPFARLVTLGSAATWLDADTGGSYSPLARRIPPVPTAHPCPHSMPILLHEAVSRHADDQSLFGAFIVANELAMRSSVASQLRPGVHPHGVHGPIASALVAALLGGMPSEQVAQAILLSSSLPMAATLSTPMQGGTVRNLWTGLGAYYGAAASRWARAGLKGSVDAYVELFDAASADDFDVNALIEGLGTRWQLMTSYVKPYACARWVHPALDAVGGIMSRENLKAEDVDTIEIDTFEFAAMLDALEIQSDLHARFSVPYCVATLVLDGQLHAPGFLQASRTRAAVADLAKRVVLCEEPTYSAALPEERPTKATIHTTNGATHTLEVRHPRGNPGTALEADEIVVKFRSNVGDTIPQSLVDDMVDSVLSDEGHQDEHTVAAFATAMFEYVGV